MCKNKLVRSYKRDVYKRQVLTMEKAVINVTNLNAGDSTGVGPLEFEVLSKGKPKFTEAEPTA